MFNIWFQTNTRATHLRNVYEGCRVRSAFVFSFHQKCIEHEHCIHCTPSSPETKLFRPQQAIVLRSIGHQPTHPHSDETEQVGWDGYWAVLGRIK